MTFPDWPETHRTGCVEVLNTDEVGKALAEYPNSVDLGVQIAWDGRVWLCVNGIAWIRFKPDRPGPLDEERPLE